MTYKDFLTGAVFTSADADLLMRQGLIVVANAAARDLIDTPTEGMRVYRLDTHKIEQHTGAVWAELSTIQSGSYTPVLTRATVGNGTIEARWSRVGDIVTVTGRFVLGSTSTIDAASGSLTVGVSLPTAAAAYYGGGTYDAGSATILDTGSQVYLGHAAVANSTAEAKLYVITGSPAIRGAINATSPMTWTTNDTLSWTLTYIAA